MKDSDSNFGFLQRSELWLSASFLLMLVVLIIPLPTFLLDMFLACNIAAAVLLLLVTLGAKKPLDLASFPSLLLLLTLLRLSLNVATTRLILLDGNAGKIVLTFGDFVVGGNLVVGIVIFLILVTIQFIVITKGATRISEVNARFTLDAMPGKQMAIDAELNSGAIDETEARARRKGLTQEAEFYGAMDGASKYVRGDAIAGLIIMVVNILGGVVLGVSDGQAIGDALQVYSILTIGDGLVSQIPALIIATSAGILVTKSASESSLGDEINQQVAGAYRSLYLGPVILLCIAVTPGFPKLPFIFLSAVIFAFVYYARQKAEREEAEAKQPTGPKEPPPPPEERGLQKFIQPERVIIEIGAGLISLAEPKHGKGIAERISTLREDVAMEHGFWVPAARIRDNLQIGVNEYRFLICGREIARGHLQVNDFLAINPGNINAELEGEPIRDPAFDLPAKWISETSRRRAEVLGFTVVDAPTVLITHLSECLRKHAHELLSRQDLQSMLEKLKEIAPTTVDEIKPDTVRPATLHQVLVNLLRERISITALERIVESAVQFGHQIKDPVQLTEKIRGNIGHIICDRFRDANGNVRVIILEPRLEHYFRENTSGESILLRPDQLERLIMDIQSKWEASRLKNQTAAVLVDSSIRFPLHRTIFRSLSEVSIIAYSEIPQDLRIESGGMIRYEDIIGGRGAAEPQILGMHSADNGKEGD
ncbi:flagellar biosynthesis protein FlhA [Rhodopirellula sp. MGV]|uniref:flagellar biosynthesis protein FlhA n=1 Tax=Rhodopirellula sp. MGV TaxID=2023130 RepID=UPI000B96CCE6|nr:flagellar biosynthesis protein FlhA [Rhodopirellula sp. MGV]OYP35218.1 flagellar biosynthesis protein FlhA [Rhodopirellula sp. MGV]PNY37767.1 flagellar biosynthesis protein FlhA [Rhodopirellula baltica]